MSETFIFDVCDSCMQKYTEFDIIRNTKYSNYYCYHTWNNYVNFRRQNIFDFYDKITENDMCLIEQL